MFSRLLHSAFATFLACGVAVVFSLSPASGQESVTGAVTCNDASLGVRTALAAWLPKEKRRLTIGFFKTRLTDIEAAQWAEDVAWLYTSRPQRHAMAFSLDLRMKSDAGRPSLDGVAQYQFYVVCPTGKFIIARGPFFKPGETQEHFPAFDVNLSPGGEVRVATRGSRTFPSDKTTIKWDLRIDTRIRGN